MVLNDFLPTPQLEECRSLLCVQPHPDDNEVGAGGTIAKLARAGCTVSYLTVTDGRLGSGDGGLRGQELVDRRRDEARRSAELLGARNALFLDVEDGSYPQPKELMTAIATIIRAVKPDCVMTCDPFLEYEFHPDHRVVGMATIEACLFAGFAPFSTGSMDNAPWRVSAVALYATRRPNTYVDVSMEWERKMQALATHQSQFDEATLDQLGAYFDFKARGYGRQAGCERAEAFKVLSPLHLHMNVDTAGL